MLTVSGINLFHDGNEWSVCLGDRDGVLPPFNGVGDTVFFEISPQTYFVPFELPHAGADNRYASSYIEIMRKPGATYAIRRIFMVSSRRDERIDTN